MAITTTIPEILNQWAALGIFDYVIPFLLIFAVVVAILQKSNVLGDNKTVQAIVALSIGLLSIQFGFVQSFFRELFPRFGIGLSIFLVLLILNGYSK